MANETVLTYNPAGVEYSETHTSKIIIRLELAAAASGQAGTASAAGSVAYFDNVSGGAVSKNISQRRRPGQVTVKKDSGMHQNIATLTLTRAWNTKKEHRTLVTDVLTAWLGPNAVLSGTKVKVTQMLMTVNATGEAVYEDIDYWIGPVQNYEGPKGNVDGEEYAKETLTVDPETYKRVNG